MKGSWLFIAFLLVQTAAYAQQPQKVYGYARVSMPMDWYKEQVQTWKKEVDKHPSDANAWYNYYYAKRLLIFHDPEDKRSNEVKNANIGQLVTAMEHAIPNTYEYYMIKWLAKGNEPKYASWLDSAEALAPERTEYLDGQINMAEIRRDISKRNLYSGKKYEHGDISAGMMYYNYNTLTGIASNAILITCGDNDTYPAWVLQSLGIRKDVTVINLALLLIDDYRARLFRELDIKPWKIPEDAEGTWAKDAYENYMTQIIKHIAGNGKKYPVYVALTTAGCKEYVKDIEAQLYLTGLTYLYSEKPVNNLDILQKNIEQLYNLDYLEHSFYPDISKDLVKQINRNYIIPLLKLYEYYNTSKDKQQKARIREMLQAVSKDTEEENEVKKYIEKADAAD